MRANLNTETADAGLPDGTYLQTKNPFGGTCNARCWYTYVTAIWSILWPVGLFCGQLVYFVVILYILWPFCIFFLVLVFCAKKNLATLLR
jgi:hypothetical protein